MLVDIDGLNKAIKEMTFIATRLFEKQDAYDIIPYFTVSGGIDSAIGSLWDSDNYSSIPDSSKKYITKMVDLRIKHSNEMKEIIKEYLKNRKDE